MLKDSKGQGFRKGPVGMNYLCSVMFEISTRNSQIPGAWNHVKASLFLCLVPRLKC